MISTMRTRNFFKSSPFVCVNGDEIMRDQGYTLASHFENQMKHQNNQVNKTLVKKSYYLVKPLIVDFLKIKTSNSN